MSFDAVLEELAGVHQRLSALLDAPDQESDELTVAMLEIGRASCRERV